MSDLISRSKLYDQLANKLTWLMRYGDDVYLAVGSDVRDVIDNMPTAYDINKVVEELEGIKGFICSRNNCSKCEYTTYCFYGEQSHKVAIDKSIEIVKHGGVRNNRKDCEYRHDNGNCLKVGGFCTAVDNKHCEKLKQGAVSDDVCEWKIFDNSLTDEPQWVYKTTCGKYIGEEHTLKAFVYCPYCSKKIKVME